MSSLYLRLLLYSFAVEPGMSNLVGTLEHRFSHGAANFLRDITFFYTLFDSTVHIAMKKGFKIFIFISGKSK